MKAYEGGYVNKTNEKPALRGEGEQERKPPAGIYCLEKAAAPFCYRSRRSERCRHGGFTWHHLTAAERSRLASVLQTGRAGGGRTS